MAGTERKGVGKARWSLAALAILTVILAVSNILVYLNLQNQIDALESDNTTLHGQMNTLQTEKSSLQSQLDSLQAQASNLTSEKDDLQNQVNSLESENKDLKDQVDSLETEKSNLQSQVNSLQVQVSDLISENKDLRDQVDSLESENWDLWLEAYSLKIAQLHRVDTSWMDLYPEPYINYYGSIFNSGNWTAYDVTLTVRIYDVYDVLINSKEIHLGNIEGKDYQVVDVDVYCPYDPYSVTTTLEWD